MNNCAKILIIYILRKCGDKKFTYLTHFNANEENYPCYGIKYNEYSSDFVSVLT